MNTGHIDALPGGGNLPGTIPQFLRTMEPTPRYAHGIVRVHAVTLASAVEKFHSDLSAKMRAPLTPPSNRLGSLETEIPLINHAPNYSKPSSTPRTRLGPRPLSCATTACARRP